MNVRDDGEIERNSDRVLLARLPLPPKELSPNARLHWAAKARAVKAYRAQCAAVFMRAKNAFWLAGPVVVDVEYRANRAVAKQGRYLPLDRDNAMAACKQIFDSMLNAGLILNDSRDHLRVGNFELFTHAKESPMGPGVYVTVRRV